MTKGLFRWQDGITGCLDVSGQSDTIVASPGGVQTLKDQNTVYFAMPSGGDSGWSGAELYYSSTDSLKNAEAVPMEYTGENAVPKAVNMEAYKPTTLKIYSATLSDAQIKAVDSAKLAGFRNTEGGEKTAASSGASITKATGKAEGEYLTSAAPVRDLFGKTFFIDSTDDTESPQNAYKGHWETGNVFINKLSDTTEYKGTYRLTGSAKCNKPVMVFSNYTGKPHTFNVETNGVKLTTAEGVSPFVIKGNGPTTINVIGSGTSEFEANGTGVFYAANNIKVTLNIIKTDAKAEVFMKNSATRLQAVSCGPYSGKVSSTTKTESGEFYTYSWKNYDNIRSAWKAAQESRGVGLIQLTSTWLLDSRLILGNNKKVKIDLGGYIIRRNLNDLKSDGEVIKVNSGAVLDIIDTCPDRSSYVGFRGGGIVGGRSNNGGGNIHIGGGTLNMTGGHIYDGQCNEDGGGIYLDNGSATLKNVTISNCQAKKSTWVDNEGGADMMKTTPYMLPFDMMVCVSYTYNPTRAITVITTFQTASKSKLEDTISTPAGNLILSPTVYNGMPRTQSIHSDAFDNSDYGNGYPQQLSYDGLYKATAGGGATVQPLNQDWSKVSGKQKFKNPTTKGIYLLGPDSEKLPIKKSDLKFSTSKLSDPEWVPVHDVYFPESTTPTNLAFENSVGKKQLYLYVNAYAGGKVGEKTGDSAAEKRDPTMLYQKKQYISGVYVGVGDTHSKAVADVYSKMTSATKGKNTLLSELDEVILYSLRTKKQQHLVQQRRRERVGREVRLHRRYQNRLQKRGAVRSAEVLYGQQQSSR